MVRKLTIIGISLIGFALTMGSNAWADRDRGDRGHRNGKGYHQSQKIPPGHHYGWDKGKGNPHRDRYEHRREYRHEDRYDRRDRDHRWDRDRRDDRRDRHDRYRNHDRHDSRFRLGVSVIDDLFGVAVAVSGRH